MSPFDRSIGAYIHIPFCRSRCSYCDFVSNVDCAQTRARYVKALTEEIALAAACAPCKTIDTVYIGGGTPSLLDYEQFAAICGALDDNFDLQCSEFTVECNPCDVGADLLNGLKSLGATRVSLGVQSFGDASLKAIGRRHDARGAIDAVRAAVASGLDVSVDAMIGLPYQTARDVSQFVDTVCDLGVCHLSAYQLKVEPNTRLAAQVARGEMLPDEDVCVDWYELFFARAQARGYLRYEISNFAQEGKQCRHNLGYWRCRDYLGLGAAAHGLQGDLRYFNPSGLGEYCASIEGGALCRRTEAVLTQKDRLDERIMLALRLREGLDVAAVEEEFQIDFAAAFAAPLAKHARRLAFDGGRLAILPQYLNVMNAVIADFLSD